MTTYVSPRAASWLQAAPFALIMTCLVLIPLGIIVVVSFMDFGFAEIIPEFYLGNWQDVLRSSLTIDTYVTVFRQLAYVWTITLVLGFTISYYLIFHIRSNIWRAIFLAACAIPFWTSGPIRMISWVPLLGREGLVNQALMGAGLIDQPISWLLYSEFSVIVVYVNMLTMAMAGPIANSMAKISPSVIQAAWDQGATEWQTIVEVIIPLIKPGFVVGTIFIITAVMGDGFLVRAMSGNQVNTPAVAIMNEINAFQFPPAAAKSVVLLVVVLTMVGLLLRFVDIRKELAR
ncbi:MAG: ABC transporter permease [Candidatus Devosia phytovorans]|uniref:ABC transporter permease n=1 Tax=Candidatus Devosia phytovorans TaxID=3121372 RepID=A0AAJ5VXK7_9HYPH|nr:ABC transporter permease [Devosia sp.]WEK05284.1 MAG: ABC transporter permease [Devosia sp.]